MNFNRRSLSDGTPDIVWRVRSRDTPSHDYKVKFSRHFKLIQSFRQSKKIELDQEKNFRETVSNMVQFQEKLLKKIEELEEK